MATVYELIQWHTDATTKVSNIVRSLALSEVGIIWIFYTKIEKDNSIIYGLPKELLWPLILVVIALTFDLLQYFIRSLITHILYRKYEKKYPNRNDREKKDLPYKAWHNYITYFLFYAKTVSVIISYVLLGCYLFSLFSIKQ